MHFCKYVDRKKGFIFNSGLPKYKTISGCRKSHIFQLSIQNGIIEKEKIYMRYGPCTCTPLFISCKNNENCATFRQELNIALLPTTRGVSKTRFQNNYLCFLFNKSFK